MQKAIHIIPFDAIGGVEVAAQTMDGVVAESVNFSVYRIFGNVSELTGRFYTVNPLRFLAAAATIIKQKPDVLIASLWRSVLVGVLVKIFLPRVKLVTFLHNSVDAHAVDFIATRLSIYLSHAVWVDSRATLESRYKLPDSKQTQIISFVTRSIKPLESKPVTPVFVFWGRLSAQKNISQALAIFYHVYQADSQAQFYIIGPDGGSLLALQDKCKVLGLEASVFFSGGKSFTEIKEIASQACFYLQTSKFEGMAMSVVEAMQLGLVPIVSPVGEIAHYCQHANNALLVGSDDFTLQLAKLINDDSSYQAVRASALATWQDKKLYSQSVLDACKALQ